MDDAEWYCQIYKLRCFLKEYRSCQSCCDNDPIEAFLEALDIAMPMSKEDQELYG